MKQFKIGIREFSPYEFNDNDRIMPWIIQTIHKPLK